MNSKHIQKIATMIFLCASALIWAGGAKESDAGMGKKVKIAFPNGAPTVCMAQLATTKPDLGLPTEYSSVKSPDLMQARILSGEADIAIVPTNLAAILYQKGVDVRLAGSVVWGILYGVTTEDIKSIADLKGKTILTLGRGLTPDITIRTIFKKAGLTPDTDVFLKYVQTSAELAPAVIAGKASIAIVPEPMLSMIQTKKPSVSVFMNVQDEWKKYVSGSSSYPQASLVIRESLIKEHPEYVKAFLQAFQQSMDWAKENPTQAGKAAYSIMGGIPGPVIAKGISRMNMEWKNAAEARPAIETYFSILMENNPKFVGGSLPDDGFYFTE